MLQSFSSYPSKVKSFKRRNLCAENGASVCSLRVHRMEHVLWWFKTPSGMPAFHIAVPGFGSQLYLLLTFLLMFTLEVACEVHVFGSCHPYGRPELNFDLALA